MYKYRGTFPKLMAQDLRYTHKDKFSLEKKRNWYYDGIRKLDNAKNYYYLDHSLYQSKEASTSELSNKGKILIVDDDEAVRCLFRETLQELGYKCDTVQNGIECLEKIQTGNNYGIVLLDVHMPKLNGIDTLRRLKMHCPDLCVIMVSASRDIENVKMALKDGAYDYVFKPFNVYEVETVIKRGFERAKLIRENKDYQENLERRVLQQTQELVGLYSDTLEALVLALDLREHETGYHSYRVTEYALTLARRLGLSDSELSNMAKGALLHDIGKIGVPDNILLKPEELTNEEWEIMQKHPVFGYKLLKKIPFLEQAAEIVLNHHERFDGNGYPQGLSGENIPVGARIFSVVDALDAMTSNRIYRKAIPFPKAVEKICEAADSQFDPHVVDSFLKITTEEWLGIRTRIESSGSEYLKKLLYQLSKT